MEKHCYHCNLPIYSKVEFFVKMDSIEQPMCCMGCKAVTEAIIDGGLDTYYRHRTQFNTTAEILTSQLIEQLSVYDNENMQQSFVTVIHNDDNHKVFQARLLIEGITCAACVWLLEKHISLLEGVQSFNVNLTNHEAQVVWNNKELKLSEILQDIYSIGYKAYPWQLDKKNELHELENKRYIRRIALAGIGTMQVMMYAITLYVGAINEDMETHFSFFIRWVSALIATPVVLYSASPFFIGAWRDLKTKNLGMDVPVAIAIGGAYLSSVWSTLFGSGEVYFDSVSMFTFFLLTGRYLEFITRRKSNLSIQRLQNLLPDSCIKIFNNQAFQVPVIEVKKGDFIRIMAGDIVPVDGVILKGESRFDEAILTGENKAVSHSKGEKILAGSTNLEHSVDIQVTEIGLNTKVANIVQLVQKAQFNKPKITKILDQVSRIFVGIILSIAVIVYIYWSFNDNFNAFWIMLSVLVVTCPCALSLATPTALTVATDLLQKNGFLVIREHVLEGLSKINHVVFDKTGTLTKGSYSIEEIILLDSDYSIKQIKRIASSLEIHSQHPLAKAFFSDDAKIEIDNVKNFTNQGVEGWINQDQYRIGKSSFSVPQSIITLPNLSKNCILLSKNKQPIAWFLMTDDSLREDAHTLVKLLKKNNKVTLLSGDQKKIVENIAKELKIQYWQAECSPEDKLSFVKKRQKKGECVLMIGDGINDVPVLAGADISVAMGSSSHFTSVNADSVLLSNQLIYILGAINLSHNMKKIIWQNIGWAIVYNIIALPLAAMGLIAPWMAALGMSCSSLIVVLNALRLAKFKVYND